MIFIESQSKDKQSFRTMDRTRRASCLDASIRRGDITVVLSDDNPRLQELNRDYLGMDAPTDVLSFPASETDPETGARYLGDILISIPRAEEQAQSAAIRLKRSCSCWWCMASCICSDTIMPRRKRKPKCGSRRRRFWKPRFIWNRDSRILTRIMKTGSLMPNIEYRISNI
jgi:hypothetical protein